MVDRREAAGSKGKKIVKKFEGSIQWDYDLGFLWQGKEVVYRNNLRGR
jgi:hypothetical protein